MIDSHPSRHASCCLPLLRFRPGLAQNLDLVNATLVDGTGAEPRPGVTVSVRGGKISAISERAPEAAQGVRRIDLKGRFLLPGLIDAHAHIESPAAALRALQSGVTTARVLGDTHFQALGTRDLVRRGFVPGPELLVSPGHIRPKPGLAFFMAYPQFGDAIGGELRGPERIAEATRAFIAKGADVIKVGASERAGLVSDRSSPSGADRGRDACGRDRSGEEEPLRRGARARARGRRQCRARRRAQHRARHLGGRRDARRNEAPRHLLRADARGHEPARRPEGQLGGRRRAADAHAIHDGPIARRR